MNIPIKLLDPSATVPEYAKEGDAGLDLTAVTKKWDTKKNCWKYGTGLAFEIPEGYVGLLFPRSSICKKDLSLSNSVGVLDSSYRGEVFFFFNTLLDDMVAETYNVGDRIGQIIILPYPKVNFFCVDQLGDTERGTGGFGSSGQ